MDNNKQMISVLWTGGWDSSYRVIELSKMDVIIQPVYILDDERISKEYELKSIHTITDMLKKRPETKAEFFPLAIENVKDLPKDEHIEEVTAYLSKKYGWGIQHNWTARIALKYPMIEMNIEKVVKGYMPTREIIKEHGKLKISDHGWVVDRDNSDDVLITALGNITLPIFEVTEVEMAENVKKWGYEDVMSNIWFCHDPIHGKPCGLCSPCHTKYDSNMRFLLPKDAQERCRKVVNTDERFGKFAGRVHRKILRIASH